MKRKKGALEFPATRIMAAVTAFLLGVTGGSTLSSGDAAGLPEKTVGGIVFVKVPAGEFMMGSPVGEGGECEHPRHRVALGSFWIGKYEVTQTQYYEHMGGVPAHVRSSKEDLARYPVHGLTCTAAVEFCERFGRRHGVSAGLPTEAEWEYACRAGTSTRYYWGDAMNGDYCWYGENSGGRANPVGTRKPNAWGLYDMSGNVWEYCTDLFNCGYYAKSPVADPKGPSDGVYRVYRGGGWCNEADGVRSAHRLLNAPAESSIGVGFRMVIRER